MYTVKNYTSKKEIKEDLAAGIIIDCYSPGPFPCPINGRVSLEGPHYPKPHRWYATGTLENGRLIKIT